MKRKRKKTKVRFDLTLKQLRKQRGLRQSDLKAFKQASVSKIEGRKDLKVSTLLDYLDAIGMDLEIRAVARTADSMQRSVFVLLAPGRAKPKEAEG